MTTHVSIQPLFKVLASTLDDAALCAAAAFTDSAHGRTNEAIGEILTIEELLSTAQALYKVILTLHRLSRKGGAQ
jgi:ribosomal protein L18E